MKHGALKPGNSNPETLYWVQVPKKGSHVIDYRSQIRQLKSKSSSLILKGTQFRVREIRALTPTFSQKGLPFLGFLIMVSIHNSLKKVGLSGYR